MDDNIILIFPGLIFLVAGLGFLFARADKSAKEKDEKRFGPLSPFNIGGWYLLIQNKDCYKTVLLILITKDPFIYS